MRETRVEKEAEICATNLANKTRWMSTNAKKWKTICEGFFFFCVCEKKNVNTKKA
jgi:hypothetical protein